MEGAGCQFWQNGTAKAGGAAGQVETDAASACPAYRVPERATFR